MWHNNHTIKISYRHIIIIINTATAFLTLVLLKHSLTMSCDQLPVGPGICTKKLQMNT